MTPTRIHRLRSAAAALALTAAATGTAIAVAGPAHAVSANCSTSSTLTINNKTAPNGGTITEIVAYNTAITVSATVTVGTCDSVGGGAPSTVEAGTLAIERSPGLGGPWTTVKSIDVSGGVNTVAAAGISGKGFLPGKTLFRAHYTGATSPEPSLDTFTDSYAFGWALPVRTTKLISKDCTSTGCTDTRKIMPAASIAGLRVKLQRRVDGAWTTIARRLVSSTGLFTYTFRPGTTLVEIPQARGYAGSFIKVVVTR